MPRYKRFRKISKGRHCSVLCFGTNCLSLCRTSLFRHMETNHVIPLIVWLSFLNLCSLTKRINMVWPQCDVCVVVYYRLLKAWTCNLLITLPLLF